MIKSKVLTITCVLLLAFGALAQDEPRVAVTWQVQKYDINAKLPTADTDRALPIKAELTLKNLSASPAQALTLRISPNAEISAITVNGSVADFTKREEKINAATNLQRLSVKILPAAPGATVGVVVDYKFTVKDNTGLASVSPVGAQFLPLSFWYPTPNSWFFARGADYAPFRVSVASDAGRTVVSSGRSEPSNIFNQTFSGQPFFLAGNWDVKNNGGVSVYVPNGLGPEAQSRASELATLSNDVKAFVTNLLGPAPDVPLRIVATRRGAGFSGGGTITVDEGIFRRSKVDSQTVMNIAEGIAKLWLGESIAVGGDGQGAVREGLPRFIATEFIEGKFGKDVADIERARQRAAYASVAQRDTPLSTVSPLDDFYYAEVANKGAMIWRLLDRKVGRANFSSTVRSNMADSRLELAELRAAFSAQKDLIDNLFDQITDTNLMVGLPQSANGETRIALRNTGSVDATVAVEAVTTSGETMKADTTIRAKSFGDVTFKTPAKIVRVEIDTEKLYPQTDYSDDVAPKELDESDVLLSVKRAFDKQDYAGAEKAARNVLRRYPRYDDVRVLLGRSLLGVGRNGEAEKEFRAVLAEKLPTARGLAWANVGLGEIAAKAGQNDQATRFADAAISADAEYGASLSARALRNRINSPAAIDEDVKAFFARFDKAAVSNRKAEVDALVVPGEALKFAGGVSGSTEVWQTQILHTDKLDGNTILAESALTVKLLNQDQASGTAVYRLVRVGGTWKLAAVEMFEVR